MLLLWLNLKHTCMTYTIFQSSATCQSRCQLLSVLICFLTQNCSKMCEHVPFGVNCNSSFIIDMNCLSIQRTYFVMIWEHGSGREATVHGCQSTNMDLSQHWRRIFLIVHLLCITESGRGITATSPCVDGGVS